MPGPRDPGGRADELLAELARWSAAERIARAAAERSRARALVGRSAAEATWEGLLVDLAEAATGVTVVVGGGHRLAGRVVGAGRDFVVLDGRGGRPALVASAAIRTITPLAATGPSGRAAGAAGAPARPGGRRTAALGMTLASALDGLAGEEAPVVLHSGDQTVPGVLLACGRDVVTVRAEGAARLPVYVPMAAVTAVELR